MRHFIPLVLGMLTLAASANEIPNQLIDYTAFEQNVSAVGGLRAQPEPARHHR